MPLPAILAGLARLGAGLAARAGAPGVARSLLGAARTTGAGAGRRAAARAAAASAAPGTAAATTAAAATPAPTVPGSAAGQVAGKTAAGGHVLEDTTLTNARALFQAIHGQAAPAAAAATPRAADPLLSAAQQIVAQSPTTTATELQAALGIPSSRAQALLAASQSPAASQVAPAATASAAPGGAAPPPTPPTPPAAPSSGSTPPGNPKPQGILDRAVDVFERAREQYNKLRERFDPVAERVKNMTLDERYKRLQDAGKLSDAGRVGRDAGTPNPSRQQIVDHSEREEERQRQEAIQQSRHQQIGQAAWSAGKRALLATTAGTMNTVATGGLAAPAWLYPIITGFERLGKTISDTNRDLSKFDENIADSFARLDYAQLRSRQQVAGATSGSGSLLNQQLEALVREVQPIRETVVSFLNVAGSSIVFIARAATLLMKWHPLFVAMHKTAQAAERMMRRGEAGEAQAATKDFLRDIRDGRFRRPPAP